MMKNYLTKLIFLFIVTHQQSSFAATSYADAIERAAPSVVSIQTEKALPIDLHPILKDPFFRKHFFGDLNLEKDLSQIQKGLGSGVIVDSNGYILTNNHLIQDATSISVKLTDGSINKAKIIGTDSLTDLAVLKIDKKNLPKIPIGTTKHLRVGDEVIAIGNPFGLASTVTKGIVSALGSLLSRIDPNQLGDQAQIFSRILDDNLIQTDASINPGNSGGALIDVNGNLIGINLAIITSTGSSHGIGFAIPIDVAKEIMQQLMEHGKISRGYLGVILQPITHEIKNYLNFKEDHGVYVQALARLSPAQQAGVIAGDIITKINGNKVTSVNQAMQLINNLKPGTAYFLEIYRRGEYLNFSIIIGQRP